MTQKNLFYKKIIYIIVIAVLLFPLYRLGNPSQRTKSGLSSGGTLAQMREANGLAEADLGQVDPASSTMKLATFGMRGVAIALLWNRSLDYEKKADWNNVVATGNQIIMLEPHFISIWDFVGWKLAYNASAQYDDYRERYRWVIRGFEFLQKGTSYNQTSPKLFTKAGWTISQKIGIADERNQYRRLFREDDEFHDKQVYKERDNWLFGRNFYFVAEDLFEKGGDIGKETRVIFYSRSRMNLIRYAEWMELDGCGVTKDSSPVFDEEHAAAAWNNAAEHWNELCGMRMKTVIEDRRTEGQFREMSLNEYHECHAEIAELTKQIEAMLPEGKDVYSILWDRWNNVLTDQHRAALYDALLSPSSEFDPNFGEQDKPLRMLREFLDGERGDYPEWANWREKLSALQISLADEAIRPALEKPHMFRTADEIESTESYLGNLALWSEQGKMLLNVSPGVLAEQLEGDARQQAMDMCDRIGDLAYQANFSKMFRDIMDCGRHERKIVLEPTAEARKAREHRHEAREKFYAGEHEKASDEFLASMASWKELNDKPENADISFKPQFQSDYLDEVDKYTIILDQLERIFPEDYPFESIVDRDFHKMGNSESVDLTSAYLEKSLETTDGAKMVEMAMQYLGFWNTYFTSSSYSPLFPLKRSRTGLVQAASLLARSLEKAGPEQLAAYKSNGLLDQYPCRGQLELLVSKGEPLYQEIQRTDLLTLTDPDNALAHREKTVELWGQILDKYPIYKFDTKSTFYAQIQTAAVDYLARLKEAGKEKPEGFALESFLPQ